MWQDRAVCRETEVGDHDLMYPDPDNFSSKAHFESAVNRAKSACARCSVRRECLVTALSTKDEHGIWGGLTWPERKKLLELGARTDVPA